MIYKIETKFIANNSIPVSNNVFILKWFVNNSIKSYKNKQIALSKTLIQELTNLFGKPNKSLRLEFMTKLWVLKFDDLIFNIYTAKNKGTSIEICNYSYEQINNGIKEKQIINFLEELHILINKTVTL